MTDPRTLEQWDKKFLWHPFTQMKEYVEDHPVIIESGKGVYLTDVEGRTYIDGVSSLWCNLLGHRHPAIDKAVRDQLGRVAHSTMLGISNVPAIRLAEKLVRLAPLGLTRVFLSDSGSEGVEIALKMAYQYWYLKNPDAPRSCYLSFDNAYHGDTIGATGVGGVGLFHRIYRALLFDTIYAPSPYCYRCPLGRDPETCGQACLERFAQLVRDNRDKLIACIIEPHVQAAGGIIVMPSGFYKRVRDITKENGVLLIADEVAVGMGRTGTLFASSREDVAPDFLVIAKGLTGGYLPVAATLATEEVYEAFLGDYAENKQFFHGHTYTGNPLGCAAALGTLDALEKEKVLDRLQPKIEFIKGKLAEMAETEHVGDVRQCGFIAGIELVKDRATREPYEPGVKIGFQVADYARTKGLLIRPLGNVIVIMPPLVIDETTLGRMLDIIHEAIEVVTAPKQ